MIIERKRRVKIESHNSKKNTQPGYINKIESISQLSEAQRADLTKVTEKYSFRTNDYYLSLINWDDPKDPIRHLIIPDMHELDEWGHLDPSGEENYTVIPGLEHKYGSTALLLVSNVCGGICRYCFRKRVFISSHGHIVKDMALAKDYIQKHEEITNVLLTGGDPLILSTNKLKKIVDELLTIDHVRIIRIGSKMPAFNPYRIIDDPALLELIKSSVAAGKQIYIMTHFNHVNELTDVAVQGLRLLQQAGAILCNQTPIIRKVNDSSDALADLFKKLSFIGVPPYYLFQCRPASGNRDYAVPIEEGYQIFEDAKSKVSGLAKRARFTISHITGKVEVVGLNDAHVYFKYHRAADDEESSRFMIFKRNPDAYWLDDYDEEVLLHNNPDHIYKSYGPE